MTITCIQGYAGNNFIELSTTADGWFVIEPADAHTGILGHQIALNEGDNAATITTSRPEHRPRTYKVNIHRTPRVHPTAWNIEMLSEPAPDSNDTYGVGDQMAMQVIFYHPVNVDRSKGRPILSVNTRPDVSAHQTLDFEYFQGAGSRSLYFQYIVPADLYTEQRGRLKLYLDANRLTAAKGSISHVTDGAPARLWHFALGMIQDHWIDGRQQNSSPRLETLDLSGITLHPEFNPSQPLYFGTTDLGITTASVGATTADGAHLIIVPADTDPDSIGH